MPPEKGDDWRKEKSLSSLGYERQKDDGDERSKRDTSTHETVRNDGFATIGGPIF